MTKARDLADFLGSGADIAGTITADGLVVDGTTSYFRSTGATAIQLEDTDGGFTAAKLNVENGGRDVRLYGAQDIILSNDVGVLARFNDGGDISFYEDTGTTPKFFWDASAEALGIGTSSPAAPLDVVGGILSQGRLQIGATAPDLLFSASGGAVDSRIYNDGLGNFIFGHGVNSATPTERLRIDSSGNVGIGTSSPASYAGFTTLNIKGSGTSTGGVIQLDTSDASKSATMYVDTVGLRLGAVTSHSVTFHTNNTERMRIDSSGNLLVGTTSAISSAKFTVNSASSVRFNLASDGTERFGIYGDSGVAALYAGTGIPLTFTTGGSERMRIDNSGNVAIGDTTATGRLTVRQDSSSNPCFVDIANYFNTSNLTFGGVRFSAYRDVAYPSYVAAMWVSGEAAAGNLGNLYFGTAQNGSSLLPSARMIILSNGDFIVTGSYAEKASGTTWANPSDQRLKDNIRDYEKGIAELMQVRVREWEFNGKGGTTEGMKGLGVIADEIMTVLPDTVSISNASARQEEQDIQDLKKFDATEITWLLVKAVQEQQAIIEDLKTRVATLEA